MNFTQEDLIKMIENDYGRLAKFLELLNLTYPEQKAASYKTNKNLNKKLLKMYYGEVKEKYIKEKDKLNRLRGVIDEGFFN